MAKTFDSLEKHKLYNMIVEGMDTALRFVPTSYTFPRDQDMDALRSMTEGFTAKLTVELGLSLEQVGVLLDLASLARASYYCGMQAGLDHASDLALPKGEVQ